MKTQPDNPEDVVYVYVRFKIIRKSIVKLIDYLKQNTKTFDCWWKDKPIGEPEK